MNEKTHCVWTRVTKPNGTVIRHAYGPYSYNYARTVQMKMLADPLPPRHEQEISVCKLLNGFDEDIEAGQ